MSDSFELFAVAAPGLEKIVASELGKLGFNARVTDGGALFTGDLADAAKANLWLRSASRVLLRVGTFPAPGRRELASRAARYDFLRFLPRGSALRIHATSKKSRLYHTGLIAEVLHAALKTTPAVKDEPAPELYVRFVDDQCTLSIDTSGELLHRRGYRQETSRAPLRETLAAGILLWCGYDGREPFHDPMCGSGTLPIEAALIATGTAPGLDRTFAVEAFAAFPKAVSKKLRDEARALRHPAASLIGGTDLHAGALGAAKRNAGRAGVETVVKFDRADVARLAAPAPTGLLATNTPYGRRVGGDDDVHTAEEALTSLGTALRGPFRHWFRAILAAWPEVTQRIALPVSRTHRLDNGGIAVELLAYDPEP